MARHATIAGTIAAGLAAGCHTGARAPAGTPPLRATLIEATLTYNRGIGPRDFGVRLWDDGARVRAAAFGGPRLVAADTGVLRAAVATLARLAASPPDTVPQQRVLPNGTQEVALCGDRISARIAVRGPAGASVADDARCRRSAAEERFRRAADSVFARLTTWTRR